MTLLAVATAAASSGIVPVKVGSQIVNANCPRDLTVAAGDPVTVDQVGPAYFIVQRYFTTSSGNTDPATSDDPPPAPVARTGKTTFTPIQTASYRTADSFSAGWRTDNDDVYQGEFGSNGNHTGCWFYGTQILSLSGATVTDAWIQVKRKNAGGITAAQTVTMGRIAESKKPSGAPTFSNSFTGPSLAWGRTNSHFDIPNSAAQALVDGSAGGLGIHDADGSPYVILDGQSSFGASGALTIAWSRS